jgi:hypothetical protein
MLHAATPLGREEKRICEKEMEKGRGYVRRRRWRKIEDEVSERRLWWREERGR